MTEHQILLNQAIAALTALQGYSDIWSRLSFISSEFDDTTDLDTCLASLTLVKKYLAIDASLQNLNPDNLPFDSLSAQLQRSLVNF
jgi:hypothetical protein